jgi:hypothetical protein
MLSPTEVKMDLQDDEGHQVPGQVVLAGERKNRRSVFSLLN